VLQHVRVQSGNWLLYWALGVWDNGTRKFQNLDVEIGVILHILEGRDGCPTTYRRKHIRFSGEDKHYHVIQYGCREWDAELIS